MDRDALSPMLREYLVRQEDVTVAYLFGSVARGEQLSSSDVDVGVLFRGALSEEERLSRRVRIAQELEKLTSREVDMSDLERVPPHVGHGVLRHKVVLKGRDEPARIEFEKSVRRNYFDLLPYRQRYLDASLRRLREGGRSGGSGGADTGALEAARRIHRRLAAGRRNQPD